LLLQHSACIPIDSFRQGVSGVAFLRYLGEVFSRRRTVAWGFACFFSILPFVLLRFFMSWQNDEFFAGGFFTGLVISPLIADFSYVCVAMGLAYWSDLFLTPKEFRFSDRRHAYISYINLFLLVTILISTSNYVFYSLIDKGIVFFVNNFKPEQYARFTAISLFFIILGSGLNNA